jgi:hypothetical protein
MCAVRFVKFCEHSLIGASRKFTLFVDESHYVELLDRDEVECVLIVNKLNVLPIYRLVIVLLLFQFENVLHEELLKILIGIIYAKL